MNELQLISVYAELTGQSEFKARCVIMYLPLLIEARYRFAINDGPANAARAVVPDRLVEFDALIAAAGSATA